MTVELPVRPPVPGVRFLWVLLTPAVLLGLTLATYAFATRWLPPAEFAGYGATSPADV